LLQVLDTNKILADLQHLYEWSANYLAETGTDINKFGERKYPKTSFYKGVSEKIQEYQNKIYIPMTENDLDLFIFSAMSSEMELNSKTSYSSDGVATIVAIVLMARSITVNKFGNQVLTFKKHKLINEIR
jgi:hypothetical protein